MKYYLSIVLIIFGFLSLRGQTMDTSSVVTVFTKSKIYHTGELKRISEDSIFIIKANDEIYSIAKSNVESFKQGAKSSYFTGIVNSNTPFFVPTAMPIGEGSHYYRNYMLFGNQFNFGISNNLDFTLGFETLSILFDTGTSIPLLQIGSKYSTEIGENFHQGFSANYYFNDEGSALVLSAPFTYGNKKNNLSVVPTYIRVDGESQLYLFANFSLSVGKRARIAVDYFRIDGSSFAIYTVEGQFKNGLTLSVGTYSESGFSVPILSCSIPFGRWY